MATTRLDRSTYLGYAIGSVGTAGYATVPGLLLAYYLTDVLGVAAGLAAVAVFVPKVWDVVIDPFLGHASDRSVQRRGSRRPFLLAGGLTLPLAFVAIFAVPSGTPTSVAALWVLAAYVLGATAFSVFQIPYIAMPAEITDGYDERTRLMSWRVAFLALGILLFGAGAPELRDAFGGGNGGYTLMAVVMGALIGAGMLGCWWMMRRARILHRAEDEPSLRAQLALVRGNRSFVVLLAAFFVQALATAAMLAAGQYYATYVLDDEKAVTPLFLALVGPSLLVMPLWARVGVRADKRAGFLAASLLFLAGTVLLLVVSLADVAGAVVFALVAVCGIGYAGMQMFPLSMLPDTVSAATAVSGKRSAGAYTGIWTAGETTGFALGPALVLVLLAVMGFVSSTADETVAQPDSAVTGVVLAFTVLPSVLIALSLPLVLRYDLTAERLAELTDVQEATA